MLEAALEYARKGRAIFPVIGKIPATRGGFKDATTDIDQVTDWWSRHPNWGIGCPIPKGFIVVDVDLKNGGYETMQNLDDLYDLEETFTAYTGGGGLHLWYRYEGDDLRQGAGLLGPGVDTRVPGKGYVVLPPSIHPDTLKPYEWADRQPTADLPDWMADMLRAPIRDTSVKVPSPDTRHSDDDVALAYRRVERAADTVRRAPEGKRNETLNAMSFIAGKMVHHGVSHEDAFNIMYAAGLDAEQGDMTEGTVNSGMIAGYDSGPDPEHGGRKGIVLPEKEQPKPKAKSATQFPPKTNAYDLIDMVLPPIHWVVEGMIPEGLTLLAGSIKVGKSFFALQLALRVAQGKPFLTYDTTQGRVAYLGLEDGNRRVQERLVGFGAQKSPALKNIDFYYEWPSLQDGGVELLQKLIEETPDLSLIVIDTLQKVSGELAGKNRYAEEYALLGPIQSWAIQNKVGLVVLTHTRKQSSSDWVEKVSGSQAITGAADTIMTIDRPRKDSLATLSVTSRDFKELELAIVSDEGTSLWSNKGEAWQYKGTEQQRTIIEFLKDKGEATTEEIAQGTGDGNKNAVTHKLTRLVKAGLIRKIGHGVYGPSLFDKTPEDPQLRF